MIDGALAAAMYAQVYGRALTGFLLIAAILCGLPAYFLGRSHGKQVVYAEAVYHGAYSVTFDPKTGDKIERWVKP
jgi:hypothetical protein